MGVAAVYTPKDFQLNDIMADIVKLVDAKAAELAEEGIPLAAAQGGRARAAVEACPSWRSPQPTPASPKLPGKGPEWHSLASTKAAWLSPIIAARMANCGLAPREFNRIAIGGHHELQFERTAEETFLVSIVIAILVFLGMIVPLPFFTVYGLGLLLIAYLILAAGVLLDNL